MSDTVYYDPYDFDIDTDPYPTWKRLRDEAPLYYNEKYGFFALSRFDDVERVSIDWRSYVSGRGTVLEVIKSGMEIPPGQIVFEDPPSHDVHRGLLARVFTPRRIAEVEPKAREFCAETLDPLVGGDGFDFIGDIGAHMPMRMIGMLLGIPEKDQQALRDQIDAALQLSDPEPNSAGVMQDLNDGSGFVDYLRWKADNPTDDIMSELLTVEFEDHTGVTRRLTIDEIVTYVNLLAIAGNETTTRLIGWTGKLLSEHPEQRRMIANDRSLIPNAIEELLRYEAPSPVNGRVVDKPMDLHGETVPAGSALLLLNGAGNRDERHFEDPDRFDITRKIDHHLSFGYGLHYCLGAALARLEARVALDEVLNRFPDWEVDWERAEQAHTSTVRGWSKLPVKIV